MGRPDFALGAGVVQPRVVAKSAFPGIKAEERKDEFLKEAASLAPAEKRLVAIPAIHFGDPESDEMSP
jgi:hypothetical protein